MEWLLALALIVAVAGLAVGLLVLRHLAGLRSELLGARLDIVEAQLRTVGGGALRLECAIQNGGGSTARGVSPMLQVSSLQRRATRRHAAIASGRASWFTFELTAREAERLDGSPPRFTVRVAYSDRMGPRAETLVWDGSDTAPDPVPSDAAEALPAPDATGDTPATELPRIGPLG
jgi:hypothetical protein